MAYVTVDIDPEDVLDQISDERIRDEYEERFSGTTTYSENLELRNIFQLMRTKQDDRARLAMWNFLCEKLGRVA